MQNTARKKRLVFCYSSKYSTVLYLDNLLKSSSTFSYISLYSSHHIRVKDTQFHTLQQRKRSDTQKGSPQGLWLPPQHCQCVSQPASWVSLPALGPIPVSPCSPGSLYTAIEDNMVSGSQSKRTGFVWGEKRLSKVNRCWQEAGLKQERLGRMSRGWIKWKSWGKEIKLQQMIEG